MSRSIALVGPGRVGQTLARALRRRSYRIGVVAARTQPRARRAVKFIGRGKAANRLEGELLRADTLLVAVPDTQITAVAQDLARLGGRGWRGKVVLHTSGARTAAELRPLRRLGAHCASFHPLFPFPRPLTSFPRGVFFGIEGDRLAVRRARALARALGGVPMQVRPQHKSLYHAAGALTSGHLLTLVDLGCRLLARSGIAPRHARGALLPLARNTLEAYLRLGERAWTGPLARGDTQTVAQHLAALAKVPSYFAHAYRTLGLAGLRLYREKSAPPSVAAALRSR